MLDTPSIVNTPSLRTAVIRLTIRRDEMQVVMGPAIGEVMKTVATQGIAPTGPIFTHHLRMDPGTFDFEVGVPVDEPVTASGRVVPGELRACTVARTIYRGPYEGLGEAWGALDAWIKSESLQPEPDLWECYVVGPESGDDASKWQTELNRPLVKANA